MAIPLCFYAAFTASKVGLNSLTVTWDIEQITRADGTRTALVTGGATNIAIGRRGLYGYLLADSNLALYDYIVTAITAGAADQQEISAVWTLWNTPSVVQTGDSYARLPANLEHLAITDVTGLVALAPTQGAVEFGQVKITADVAGEGALHIKNNNATGIGQKAAGGTIGILTMGTQSGLTNAGDIYGEINQGNTYGQFNYGLGASATGQRNYGALAATDPAPALASDMTTVLARLGVWTGTGVNTVLGAFKALLSKVASAPSNIGGTFNPATDSTEALSEAIAALSLGSGSGTGSYTDTITDGTNPLDGVRVQLSTDAAGAHRIYEAYTNASGIFAMHPDPGVYYVWFDLAGYNGTQGAQVTVT